MQSDHYGTVAMSGSQPNTTKRAVFFVAPICNQLAASVMHGLSTLGYTLYANRGWCCGVYDPSCWRIPVIKEWNWCILVSDDEILALAEEPDMLVIGTVRYEPPAYWEAETDGAEVATAARVQLDAIERGIVDAFIDDSDYDAVYPELCDVPKYFKREATNARPVISLPFCLCPWIPTTPFDNISSRSLLLSACFPIKRRKTWDRVRTLNALSSAFHTDTTIRLGDVYEPVRTRISVATSNRQGPCYLATIRGSQCSLSLPGEGWDTFRFWEILACGSCLLSPRQVLRHLCIDPPPTDGKEYLGFDTDDELIELIVMLKNRRDYCIHVAKNGQEWAMKFHSGINRAQTLLAVVRSPDSI